VRGSRSYWRPNGATLDFGAEERVVALMEQLLDQCFKAENVLMP